MAYGAERALEGPDFSTCDAEESGDFNHRPPFLLHSNKGADEDR